MGLDDDRSADISLLDASDTGLSDCLFETCDLIPALA